MRLTSINKADDYSLEICSYLLSTPTEPQLLYHSRKDLIEFLSYHSTLLKLTSETFFEACRVLDLLDNQDYKSALVSLWISSKIHENYGNVPLLRTLCSILEVERQVLVKLEIQVLKKINYSSGKNVEEFIRVFGIDSMPKMDLARLWGEVLLMNGYTDPKECARCAVILALEGGDSGLLTPWIREKYGRKEFGNIVGIIDFSRLFIDTRLKSVNTGLLTPPKEEYGHDWFCKDVDVEQQFDKMMDRIGYNLV